MSEGPVFESKSEADVWNSIQKAEAVTNPKSKEKALSDVFAKVFGYDGELASQILCQMITIVSREEAEGWKDDIRDLVGKRRPQDCRPSLTAAMCLATKGMIDDARSYIAGMSSITDVPMFCRTNAQILKAEGKDSEASVWLQKALRSNRLDHKSYEMLCDVDFKVSWRTLEACERLAAGMEYEEPEDTGAPELAIYRIYKEWYEGNRETATRQLISSDGYKNKLPDYSLISARMSRDEKDWHSSEKMYEQTCAGKTDDVSILCETAKAYLSGEDYDTALARYRGAEALDPGSPSVMRGLIEAYMDLGKNSEALEIIKEFLSSEMASYNDFARASTELLRMGYVNDAGDVAKRIVDTYPGDAIGCIVLSRVAINNGNLREAEEYAETGVRYNKKNPEVLAQMSRVYLVLRRISKAARYAKRAVNADSASIPALMTMMEVYRETGDNDRTMDMCREILKIDPKNDEAADALSNLEMAQVIKGKNASSMLPEVSGSDDFVRLLSTLIAEEKYAEAEKLCRDNDSKYGSVAAVRRLRGNAEYALGEYLKASASFSSAAVLVPDDAEVWHSKGLADEAFGDLDSAEEAYNEAVLLDMKNAQYWISKGCVQERKGNTVGAVESFNHAIELDQTSTYALVKKATILADTARFSDALNFMDLAEATDPKNIGIQKMKMKIYLAAARYSDVTFIGKKLMKKNPDPSTIACFARAEIGLGDTSSAKKVLGDAMAANPDNLELLTVNRELCQKLGDNESVIGICRDILKVDPYNRDSKRILADALYKVGRGDEASMLYSTMESKDKVEVAPTDDKVPKDPVSMFKIAKSLLEVGDVVGAGRMADKTMALDPDNVDYILFRASVYRKTGDSRVAEAFLMQYLEKNPTSGPVYEAVGDLRADIGDLKGSSDAYGSAIKNGLVNPKVYVKLGMSQEGQGANAAAINSYSTAVKIDPHDADAGRKLSALQMKSKDSDSALRSIQASINADPSADAYVQLASIYQSKKDREGVRDAYKGFLRYDNVPDDLIEKMVSALNSVGLRSEAVMLKSHMSGKAEAIQAEIDDKVPASSKRCSERIMRRAYMLGSDISDPDILDALDVDAATAKEAVDYLADIPDNVTIIPGTTEFDRMEHLTYNAIAKGKNRDLEAMTVECAYVAGGAKDVDEAKRLLGYIRTSRAAKVPRDIPENLKKMATTVSADEQVEQVMMDCKVGVMSARMILACAEEK